MTICPKCHRPITIERLGVRMTPLKARIIDAIKCSGDIGVTSEELRFDIYRGYAQLRVQSVVRVHIWQINDLLEETDWHIVARPHGRFARWYLRRRPPMREAAE
jgi:hypothetical protein